MPLTHMDVQQMGRREDPGASLAHITMRAVVVNLIVLDCGERTCWAA